MSEDERCTAPATWRVDDRFEAYADFYACDAHLVAILSGESIVAPYHGEERCCYISESDVDGMTKAGA